MMTKLAVAVFAASGLLLSVGVAYADSADDRFVAALSSQGIPGDRGVLISVAHQFCDAQSLPRVGIGMPSPYTMQLHNLRDQLFRQGLSQLQTDQLASDAAAAYCPDRLR
ncbi:DUF732 domain-containing protein [Mycobacterium sp. E3339]|uniref:DUF732 domain-containing protein n=1 Tax=Mycobacterium sp. E3339 TaxID=1834146 RepID=UPI000800F6A5|nr:DUF732 domain-containing protein [Mycobacterium sp. E3339]OBG65986.1 hypothetical protein A5702_19180 [Mycobacterium sp. E3339]